MSYLYMQCKNWNVDKMKKETIAKYGLQIDEKSLFDNDWYEEFLKKVFAGVKKNSSKPQDILGAIEECIWDKADIEHIFVKTGLFNTVNRILKMIYSLDYYIADLSADVLMGLLWLDEDNDIIFLEELEHEWYKKPPNKSIDAVAARKNYPYAQMRDYPKEPIPGGCAYYHALMILQKNMGIFDYHGKTKSIQKYAYPKTNEIYQDLKNSPIENLILLERVQGVEYSNQLFEYFYDITELDELKNYKELILKGLEIEPMFLRKSILHEVMEYVSANKRIEYMKSITIALLENICYEVNKIYKHLFRHVWVVYLVAYNDCKKHNKIFPLYSTRLWLTECWQEYYNDAKVNEILSKDENIYDWKKIRTIYDCFSSPSNLNHASYDTMINSVEVKIMCVDGGREGITLRVRKPLNALGEEIRKLALNQCRGKSLKKLSDDEKRNELYHLEKKLFHEMWVEERDLLKEKEPKGYTDTLKSMHVYAIIHKWVIQFLGTIINDVEKL